MKGYIDFHAHILPGVDHGSQDITMSLAQLKMAADAGVSHVVATPHFYPDVRDAEQFFCRREEARTALTAVYSGLVTVLYGAEVFLCEGLQHYPRLQSLCIEGTNVMLVELPAPPWSRRYEDTLEALKYEYGLDIVLAHVDRYAKKDMERLLSFGYKGQINAGSLSRISMRKKVLSWVDKGYISALGSDIHGMSKAYGYYARSMLSLGERGEKIQTDMEKLLARKDT